MLEALNGYKTYIVALIGLVIVALQKAGVIDLTADTAEIAAAIWSILVLILKGMANKADKGKILPILLLLLLPLALCGCSGIVADARHAALIDTTASVAGAISDRAAKEDVCTGPDLQVLPPCDCVGEFTKAEIRDILKSNAEIWRYFREAKSGQGKFPTAGLMGE